MISSIKITDNFTEINEAYKKFKHTICKKWHEANEISFQAEESNLISSIKSLLEKVANDRSKGITNIDDDLMRVLIASKTLSCFSSLNQDQCVCFFTQIEKYLPESIPKRRFFYKCAVKVANNKSHYLWDNFFYSLHDKILPIKMKDASKVPPIENILIFTNILIQYAPDFVCLFSTEIFCHLFRIIQDEEYILDLNYNILSYTNETIDTYFDKNNNNKKYYANYAIELLRLIFSKISLIRYQTIEISTILQWEKTKALATLSVLFEKSPESLINNHIDSIYEFLMTIDQNDPEFHCLLTRNLIFCSLIKEDMDIDIINKLILFNDGAKENFVSGKLLNIKLLIDKNHPILDDESFDKQLVVTLIYKNVDSANISVKRDAYDLLNSCLLFNYEQQETFFEIDSELIEKLREENLLFEYNHVIDLLIKNNENNSFLNKLVQSLNGGTLESLQFLNKYNELDESNAIFNNYYKNLPNQNKNQIINAVRNLFYDPNPEIKALVPFVLSKISPNDLFSNQFLVDLFNSLIRNPNEKVRLSILQCFNDHINSENFDNYPEFRNQLNQLKTRSIFKILLNDYSPRRIQIETIKFVCKLSQLGMNFNEIIIPYLNYFSSFSKEKINDLFGFDHYYIFPQKLAIISESLPFIFESFPSLYQEFFQSFYNFALDYMNCASSKESVKHIQLQTKAVQNTYFQRKFYKTTFRSFIESLRIIHRKNPLIFFRNCKDVINFCTTNLANKMDELETQCVLSLLEQILVAVDLDWLHQNYTSSNINALFTSVFDTGSRFASPAIHQLVFKILGFLGVQFPMIKEQPTYECEVDKKDKFNKIIQDELLRDKNVTSSNNCEKYIIYYVICFYSVLNVLEDESMSHFHFLALESLIKITACIKCNQTNEHLIICMNYFNKMLSKSEGHDKKKFVPLLGLMLKFDRNTVRMHVLEYCRIFHDLWEYGSIGVLKEFTEILGDKLVPCLELIIHLIQSLDDIESVIDNLILIYENCYLNSYYNYFEIDIITMLVQMGNNGHYEVFKRFIELTPKIYSITSYYPSILHMCLQYVNKLDQLSTKDKEFFDDVTKLVTILISTKTDDLYFDLFTSFKSQITNAFNKYPEQKKIIDDAITNRRPRRVYSAIINNNFVRNEINVFLSAEKAEMFKKLIIRINDYINDDINSLYIQQWLNELIQFCIKNSPNPIVSETYLVAKSNTVFANSIFNISFLSFMSTFKLNTHPEIPSTLLAVLKHKNTPDHCKAMIIDLIEFMDRFSHPLFKPKDFKCPLNMIFSSKPPISLRFAIRSFEDQIQNAANDLQLAFLNVGQIDEYRQFSKLNNISSNSEKKYQLPIFTGSAEETHNLENAYNLFKNKMWDVFDNETEQFHKKTITHLFRAAKEIYKYYSANPDFKNKPQTRIEAALKEIDLGFDSLGIEGGPQFNQGFTSVLQSIVYAQQLTELKEMALSMNDKYNIRLKNSGEIVSFLPPILLLRIVAKGEFADSLPEKLKILQLCRLSNRWESMKMYKDFFGFDENNSPIEVQYEMMYYKMANNIATEEEFDSIIKTLGDKIKENRSIISFSEYRYSNIIDITKYNKAVYLAHSSQKDKRWKSVISICEELDDVDSINLLGLANYNIFQLTKDQVALNHAIKHYINAAIKCEKFRISNLLHIIYLLFTYYNHDSNTFVQSPNDMNIESIEKMLNKIPLHFYLEVMDQFISYVSNLKENSFKRYIMKILTQLMIMHPYGVIYDYSFSLFCDKININGTIVNSPIKEIKDKINSPLFEEAFKLTKILQKVNLDFLNTIIYFYKAMRITLLLQKVEEKDSFKKKLNVFYPKLLVFINDFIQPLHNYYENLPNAYQPNLNEISRLRNFRREFTQIKTSFERYKEIIRLFIEEDNEYDFGQIASILKQFLDRKSEYDSSINDFNKISKDIVDIRDLNLPIFGVYKYNEKPILIHKFDNIFEKKSSLKAPKQIKVYGNDGHAYQFILKQSEDLRSDGRVMIFFKFLNRLIQTKIKTFTATPLTPKLGLIQYVKNSYGLNDLIEKRRRIVEIEGNKLGSFKRTLSNIAPYDRYKMMTVIQRYEFFLQIVENKERGNDLKESFWFFTPNSETWLKFVHNYTQTCAVSSIAGYIMGLGDRHLKNIMIDSLNGSVFHIDFNDLFEVDQMKKVNKDMTPFRLTRNLVAAMGPCGSSGTFSLKCIETLAAIRQNRDLVLNILNVFVESPIHPSVNSGIDVTRNVLELISAKKFANRTMKRIAKKLNGTDVHCVYSLDDDLEGKKNVQPMSVHDHVEKLIKCATDPYHFASGYYGWAPWD